jgi:hypothetical protein
MGTYIEELTELTTRAKARRIPLEKLQAETTPDKLVSLRSGYGEYLLESRKYIARDPSARPESYLEQAVRSNLGDVYKRIEA